MVAEALDPRIALPCNEMRALFAASVVAVRARTVRTRLALARDVAAVVRDTTLRDVAPFARAAFARDVTARDWTVLRDTVERDALPDVREAFAVARGLARAFRALPDARDAFAVATESTGAIGSANTARIDNIVEHTKNAPANKKTVLIAFLTEFATF